MDVIEISDPKFREAVKALDIGDVNALEQLLSTHPRLVQEHLDLPDAGYFSHPYLLWFIAENPIRTGKLPDNIEAIAKAIIQAAERASVSNLSQQINYTLSLVCSGKVTRECGVQLELIDLLIDNGADPTQALIPAAVHKEIAAVERLLAHNATLSLPVAVSVKRKHEIRTLSQTASADERQQALAIAAFYGDAETLSLLIAQGANINAYCPDGFHAHATPLHHAVSSGSLSAVKILVEAGASLLTEDKIYQGTPIGWARHMQRHDLVTYLQKSMEG
jgi:ankyrin repeat protein